MLESVFKGKGDERSCNAYRGVKLSDHALKIVEKVLKRRIRELINVDEMQLGFMSDRGTTEALFFVRKIQEEYRDKKRKS